MRGQRLLTAALAIPLAAQTKTLGAGPQRMELTLERREGAVWKVVDPSLIFAQNDQVRFRFKTSFAGHLYVMNQGTSGDYSLLFPRADTGQENRVEAGKEYLVPATGGAFRITGPPGHDIVYWMITPLRLASGEQAKYIPLPPPPPRTEQTLKSLTPRCDDTVLRARGDCVDGTAGARRVAGEALPENMKGVAGATPRELFFIREKEKSVVSSPAPLGGPVVYQFRLAHK